MSYSVIPVKTGIQSFQYLGRFWIPACPGMTTFYDFIDFRSPQREILLGILNNCNSIIIEFDLRKS